MQGYNGEMLIENGTNFFITSAIKSFSHWTLVKSTRRKSP